MPLKYRYGAAMLANLLITLVKSKVKRPWAFSNMVSLIRNQLMNYVDIYRFLEDPEGCWRKVTSRDGNRYDNSLFSEHRGLLFEISKKTTSKLTRINK